MVIIMCSEVSIVSTFPSWPICILIIPYDPLCILISCLIDCCLIGVAFAVSSALAAALETWGEPGSAGNRWPEAWSETGVRFKPSKEANESMTAALFTTETSDES